MENITEKQRGLVQDIKAVNSNIKVVSAALKEAQDDLIAANIHLHALQDRCKELNNHMGSLLSKIVPLRLFSIRRINAPSVALRE